MSEDLGLFEETTAVGRRVNRLAVQRVRSRRRRRRLGWVAMVLVLLAGLGIGGFVVARNVLGLVDVPDYAGGGTGEVIVRVRDGASTSTIAATLASSDVVASARAFTNAAKDADRIRSVQPGYYLMHTRMSGAAAVGLLLDPATRVGQLEIRGGAQLDDTRGPKGETQAGVLSLISQASCAKLNGMSTCIPADQLRAMMAVADPASLGVPSWAQAEVAKADPARRLEGLILPGNYDLRPGTGPLEVLHTVVSASADQLTASGLAGGVSANGLSPYQLLVEASLVEREGVTGDFAKIARVIDNRLARPIRLQLDSTINYLLDVQTLRTSPADRDRPGPYNTYLDPGLPPTPIGAPSEPAIRAALHPADGPWLYFVKCQTDGTSCFSTTQEEHDAARRDALARGIY